jgi:rRNA maturation endonuclease Nob1
MACKFKKPTPWCVRATHSPGLRCHLCGQEIPVGEDHEWCPTLGSVHLDRTVCERWHDEQEKKR